MAEYWQIILLNLNNLKKPLLCYELKTSFLLYDKQGLKKLIKVMNVQSSDSKILISKLFLEGIYF